VRDDAAVLDAARSLTEAIAAAGVRVQLDDRVDLSAGRRATDWELKGVPLRVEIGPRDLETGSVPVVDRTSGAKTPTPLAGVPAAVTDALEADQAAMYAEAAAALAGGTTDVASLEEAREASQDGFARLPWSVVGPEGEADLGRDGITVRCLLRPDGSLPDREDEPDLLAVTARSY
jgi:prolyl-tRNA synthetase